MKHLKLFEAFGTSSMSNFSLLVADASWEGITRDGNPDMFIFPSSVSVQYYPNPSRNQIQKAFDQSNLRNFEDYTPADTAEEVADDFFGGDQNGSNLYQRQPLYILVDSKISAGEIKSELENILNEDYNKNTYLDSDFCEDILGNPSEMSKYTRRFLTHCQSVVDGNISSMRRSITFRTA
jgi:hypothetical protein